MEVITSGKKDQTARSYSVNKLLILSIAVSLVLLILPAISCKESQTGNQENNGAVEKASSQLLIQVGLKREQAANPDPERLEQMKNMGMNIDNLESQRIFIHLKQALSPSQTEEIEALGVTLYQESWIPPVGNHPTGFLIAEMPVDKLEALAELDYVIRLDTAETQLEPQNGLKPDVEDGLEPQVE